MPSLGGNDDPRAELLDNLAEVRALERRFPEALAKYQKAGRQSTDLRPLALSEEARGDDDPRTTRIRSNLGAILTQLDQFDRAEQVLLSALKAIERGQGPDFRTPPTRSTGWRESSMRRDATKRRGARISARSRCRSACEAKAIRRSGFPMRGLASSCSASNIRPRRSLRSSGRSTSARISTRWPARSGLARALL